MKPISQLKDSQPMADSRGAATLIDCLCAFLCMLPVSPITSFLSDIAIPWWAVAIIAMCLWCAITINVFAAFESSKLCATPGKLVCGLVVVGDDGQRIPFRSALKRNSLKYSFNIYGLFPLFAKNWAADAAIHDVAAGSFVVSTAEFPR